MRDEWVVETSVEKVELLKKRSLLEKGDREVREDVEKLEGERVRAKKEAMEALMSIIHVKGSSDMEMESVGK